MAPPAVQGLKATRGDTCVDLSWTKSPAADLNHYSIYQSTSYFTTVASMTPAATVTGANTTTYKAEGLTNGVTYWFAVTAVDGANNEEKMVVPVGSTPQDLAPRPVTGFTAANNYPEIILSWNASTAYDFASYKIYQSLFPIGDVLGLTPIVQIDQKGTKTYTATGTDTGDFEVKTTYYFAIVAEDLAGHVSSPAATSIYLPDLAPVVSITQPANGATITRPITIQAAASDPDGVARVEFFIDGSLVATDTTAPYTFAWNIFELTPRSYQIKVKATDTKDYTSEQTITVNVEPGPPPAPVITSPANNSSVKNASMQVVGSSLPGAQAVVLLNGQVAAGPLTVEASGYFRCDITLKEGQNWIEATAQDQGGTSAKSAAVLVTLDLTTPDPPRLVQAASLASGKVRITWQAPLNETPSGYNIYRANSAFSDIASAQKLNSSNSLITGFTFDDVPSPDGTYYYGLIDIDSAGNPSALSQVVEGISDSVPPEVTSLTITPHGPVDQPSGRTGPGQVDIAIVVSEELLTTPFMSITPQDGFPITINLARLSATQYSGSFEITGSTPSGVASIIFSGRDMVGNRGTNIDAPHTITIDTAGPAITSLQISPQAPIKNDVQKSGDCGCLLPPGSAA